MNNSEDTYPKSISMKIIVFVFTFISLSIISLPTYSQSKTQSDTTSYPTDSIIKYLTPLEYAFMMHEETPWMIKVNLLGNRSMYGGPGGKVSFERRIAPNFTINLGIDYSPYLIPAESIFGYYFFYAQGINSFLESRWYYRLGKQKKNKIFAKHMSDNYLSFGMSYTHIKYSFSLEENYYENSYVSTYVKWGMQRRFLNHGHADIGIKAGIGFFTHKNRSSFFHLTTFADIGIAFTKDKYKLDHEKLCPILRCYKADKFIFKSNLNNLLSVSLFKYAKRIIIVPHIAFEYKIGKSSFSINTELRSFIKYDHIYDQLLGDGGWSESLEIITDILIEGRWYYNLHRRMLKGKSGNGLSANYISIGGRYVHQFLKNYASNGNYTTSAYKYHITTGFQRLFSKHMYLDMNIGVTYRPHQSTLYFGPFFPVINTAIGYRF